MVRIFAGWRKGAQMSGVRGSGVEGGLRAVPRGRPAKKKNNGHIYSISAKSGKRAEKCWYQHFLYTPKSEVLGDK